MFNGPGLLEVAHVELTLGGKATQLAIRQMGNASGVCTRLTESLCCLQLLVCSCCLQQLWQEVCLASWALHGPFPGKDNIRAWQKQSRAHIAFSDKTPWMAVLSADARHRIDWLTLLYQSSASTYEEAPKAAKPSGQQCSRHRVGFETFQLHLFEFLFVNLWAPISISDKLFLNVCTKILSVNVLISSPFQSSSMIYHHHQHFVDTNGKQTEWITGK